MTENADDILAQLPARLRAARMARGLSLEAASRLSGVSRSMVSQIERGESSPTVATLWNLTRALQVDFAGLLEGGRGDGITVVTATETPVISGHGQNCKIRILSTPEQAGHNEVYDLRFGAGGRLESDPHGTGAREHLTVIEGQVRVRSGSDEQVIGVGDTARYAADVPHAIMAEGGTARAFLIVETP